MNSTHTQTSPERTKSDLTGTTTIVVGASRGLGRGIATARGRCRHRRTRLRADRRRPGEAAVTQATADQDVTSRRANTTAAAVTAAAT
jgi:NAD(P)-dependent dehydrogenase (short-subunit alcohol dehydrogenase family)